jgi:phosphatidylglycerol:prolipoprotein diacylglycerol transferase
MRFPEGLPPSTGQDLARLGVDLPAGTQPFEVLAVHPTQLYEVAALLLVFWVLYRSRAHQHALGWLLGLYLTLVGTERFLVEFIRAKDDRLLGAFTVAQLTSVVLIVAGIVLLNTWRENDGVTVSAEGALKPRAAG